MQIIKKLRNEIELFFIIHIKEGIFLKRIAEKFYKIFGGHVFFEVLRTATELDLFTLLDREKKMTAEDIGKNLKIEEQPCRILLLPLVALGLLKKRGKYYSNPFVSKLLFSKASPRNVRSYINLQHHVYYPALHHFYDSVIQNRNLGIEEFAGSEKTLYERLEHTPPLQKMFQDSMEELSSQSNPYLVKHLDLTDARFLCDVGGGNGTNIIRLASQNPHLKAAVLDLPEVTKIAEENIRNHGLQDRLTTFTLNAFTDDFPSGVDCFIFCHFFTMWSKDEDRGLLEKAYRALPKGGRVVVFNMMQKDDLTGPLSAALGSPYFLACATGRGMVYSWSDYKEIFHQSGFERIQTKKLPLDHGIIIGTK